ncbi:uncharacterized protein PV07_08748 [Cladophialophora immunda]|uniref:Uncharacterized protein n=1 Tax=Cladophialophora immunda TaxID=569365 RepID=A0A0D2AKT4_9EURO|nr:uncharacterized protein PV07_08748 [Cladophialophora immunda]KIW25582.1 hypothetical protein PV07_08748 [Cladophialophora immunda]OQV07687.1 hypothetical protein CLAIMM_12088 [Cladophialophora immunda]
MHFLMTPTEEQRTQDIRWATLVSIPETQSTFDHSQRFDSLHSSLAEEFNVVLNAMERAKEKYCTFHRNAEASKANLIQTKAELDRGHSPPATGAGQIQRGHRDQLKGDLSDGSAASQVETGIFRSLGTFGAAIPAGQRADITVFHIRC